jgi:hypothetical protein
MRYGIEFLPPVMYFLLTIIPCRHAFFPVGTRFSDSFSRDFFQSQARDLFMHSRGAHLKTGMTPVRFRGKTPISLRASFPERS